MTRALLLALSVMLASCSWLPVKEQVPARNAAELTQWDLRAAIIASGAQSGRASLRWKQQGEEFTLTVSGPFGVGSTRLQGTLAGVMVTRGDKQYYSADPARDLAQAVGAPVPLDKLMLWVRGLSGSAESPKTPLRWSWAGWQISIAEQAPVSGYLLPVEMSLVGVDQRLELRRMRWVIPQPPEG